MTGLVHDPWERKRLFTVGHSNRAPEQFLEVLRGTGVRALVDVRRYPSSRRYPHFNRSELGGTLLRHGIIYHHLGKYLGGMLKTSYESYMRTPEFRRGLGDEALE